MRELTQTSLHPNGNCWQTCVACLLDLDPEELPPQADYDKRRQREDGSWETYGPSYDVPLGAYLRDHHSLGYARIHSPPELLPMLAVRDPGWHLMEGRTVRSDLQHDRHVVVARYGQMVWDPHPSRVGLLDSIRWAFLVPFPKSWGELVTAPCVCPKCATQMAVAT
jgi:hypothetical protein